MRRKKNSLTNENAGATDLQEKREYFGGQKLKRKKDSTTTPLAETRSGKKRGGRGLLEDYVLPKFRKNNPMTKNAKGKG